MDYIDGGYYDEDGLIREMDICEECTAKAPVNVCLKCAFAKSKEDKLRCNKCHANHQDLYAHNLKVKI